MNKTMKVVLIVACTAAIALSIVGYGLFHGYFDQGDFRVLSVQRSPSRQFAMVAKRSDHEALNGDEIFVLLGDHIFAPAELKHALHGPSVIFSADRDCLTLKWQDPHNLLISCTRNSISTDEINRQLHYRGDVVFAYANIANAK
jgi:hypothetical protein